MKKLCASVFAGVLALFAVDGMAAEKASGTIINNKGEEIGRIDIQQGTKGVVINIDVKNLPPGRHGMHFHAVGDCSDIEKFKAAKGHVNPHKLPHGFFNPEGPHEGNLPNLIVAKDGTAVVEMYSVMVSLSSGDAALLDGDGSTLVIHTDPDDHFTQPIGGAGARIGCAVIK